VDNLFFLDAEDGNLRNEEHVQDRVLEILREISPDEIFFPHEKDAEVYHYVTNKIVKNAVWDLNLDLVGYI